VGELDVAKERIDGAKDKLNPIIRPPVAPEPEEYVPDDETEADAPEETPEPRQVMRTIPFRKGESED
jgi:hypothetical protein